MLPLLLHLYTEKSMTRNTSDALPFVRERLGAGQRLTAPDKLGWNRKTRTNRKPTELQPEVKENPERYQLREKKRESLHSNSRIFLPVGVSLPPVLPPGPEWQSGGTQEPFPAHHNIKQLSI